jgi:Xaa-Pro aminopeptidase
MDSSRRDFLGWGAAAAAGVLVGCRPGIETDQAPSSSSTASAVPALPPPLSKERFSRRRGELASRMKDEGFDFLLATPGSAFTYLTGADLRRSERLIALVLDREGGCRCIGPAFERQRLEQLGLPGELTVWQETEDPAPLLASLLSIRRAPSRIAVEGTTWFDDLEPLSRRIPSARIASATPLLSELRMRKDPDELALIRAAIVITLEAIRRVMGEAEKGTTEKDLLKQAAWIAGLAGASLDGTVQFGANTAVPHAGAGSARLRSADVILFDLVAEVRGYHSDISRTFAFGAPSSRFQQIFGIVRRAQEEAIRAVRPGTSAGSVDEAARSFIRRSGFGRYFTHRLGHGFGLQVHEPPYLVGGNSLPLREGMTLTVEPGIYLPGEFGVRLEDDVLVTAAGAEVLSAAPAPRAA